MFDAQVHFVFAVYQPKAMSFKPKKFDDEDDTSLTYTSSLPCCVDHVGTTSSSSLPDDPAHHPRYGTIGFRMIPNGSHFSYKSLKDCERAWFDLLADHSETCSSESNNSTEHIAAMDKWFHAGDDSKREGKEGRCEEDALSPCAMAHHDDMGSLHKLCDAKKAERPVSSVKRVKDWFKQKVLRIRPSDK